MSLRKSVVLLPNKNSKKDKKKKKKRTALVLCQSQKQFWTTQEQFWQWVRDRVVAKIHDDPLTGIFNHKNEEYFVMCSNTVLNLAAPNHMREALISRRMAKQK